MVTTPRYPYEVRVSKAYFDDIPDVKGARRASIVAAVKSPGK